MKKIFFLTILTSFLIFSYSYAEQGEIINSAEDSAAYILAMDGIISSNSSSFRLNDTITRKEMIKIVAKVAGGEVSEKCEGKFRDVANDWGCKYIEWALKEWFISSNDGKFRPDEDITKAESLKLILKAKGIQKLYNTSNWQEDYVKTVKDLSLISPSEYVEYTAPSRRGWIFAIIAKGGGSPLL